MLKIKIVMDTHTHTHTHTQVLSQCDSSMVCHVEVGSYLNVAVHAEEGFHHGDWADEVSWKLFYKKWLF